MQAFSHDRIACSHDHAESSALHHAPHPAALRLHTHAAVRGRASQIVARSKRATASAGRCARMWPSRHTLSARLTACAVVHGKALYTLVALRRRAAVVAVEWAVQADAVEAERLREAVVHWGVGWGRGAEACVGRLSDARCGAPVPRETTRPRQTLASSHNRAAQFRVRLKACARRRPGRAGLGCAWGRVVREVPAPAHRIRP